MAKLTKEERSLVEHFEAGKLVSVLTPDRAAVLQQAAANTFKKDKRINIRLSGRDLEALQCMAAEEGIPYQTLVSSILHKYASGTLVDLRKR